MKIATKELRRVLTACSLVTPTRTPDERLYYGLINGHTITVTDSQMFLANKVECEDPFKEPVTFQVSTLKQICSTTSAEFVLIESTKSGLVVKCGKTKFSLPSIDPARFPIMPAESNSTYAVMDSAVLKDAVDLTLPCVDEVTIKSGLGGVCFCMNQNGFRIIASDGVNTANYWVDKTPRDELIESITPRSAKCLMSICESGPVSIGRFSGGLTFTTAKSKLLAPCIVGKFQIKRFETTIDILFAGKEEYVFSKDQMLEGLNQVGIILPESNAISLNFDGSLTLVSQDSGSEIQAEIPAIKGSSAWSARFQQRILMKAMRSMAESLVVKIASIGESSHTILEVSDNQKSAVVVSLTG